MNCQENEFTLNDDQHRAITVIQDNFINNVNTVCCMGVGSGKTEIACNIIESLIKNENPSSICLVMAPRKDILIKSWKETLERHKLKHLYLTAKELEQRKLSTQQEFCLQDYQIILGTYSMFIKKGKDGLYNLDYFNNSTIFLLVLDEIHNLSNNPEIDRKIRKKIINFHTQKRLGLSATPLNNSLDEIQKSYEIINPTDPLQFFQENHDLSKNDSSNTILELSDKFMVYTLPKHKKIEMLCTFFTLPLNEKESNLYNHLSKNSTPLTVPNQMTSLLIQKKVQTLLHKYILNNPLSVYDIALLVIVESLPQDDKLIIFDNLQENLNFLSESSYLKKMKPLLYHGGIKKTKREDNLIKFLENDENRTLLTTFSMASEGLNLQNANHIIITSIPWTPARLIQAIGRIYRQGQSKPCCIYILNYYDPIKKYSNFDKDTLPVNFYDKYLKLSIFNKYHDISNDENPFKLKIIKIPNENQKESLDDSMSFNTSLTKEKLREEIVTALKPYKELRENYKADCTDETNTDFYSDLLNFFYFKYFFE